jgi:hypothetical protein
MSATDVPPNFITSRAIAFRKYLKYQASQPLRADGRVFIQRRAKPRNFGLGRWDLEALGGLATDRRQFTSDETQIFDETPVFADLRRPVGQAQQV